MPKCDIETVIRILRRETRKFTVPIVSRIAESSSIQKPFLVLISCLRNRLPTRHWIEYNKLLVSWGQNICKPVSPLCGVCAAEKYCRKIGVVKHR